MKKIILFLMFSISSTAQKVEYIKLDQNIKDKRKLTKSLTLIDNRDNKDIGTLSPKGEQIEIKFDQGDLKNHVEKWFAEDNKEKGNNDIVLMLEELKIYEEQDEGQKTPYAKAKLKISSFIKRNDRYYFINRFDNVIISDPNRNLSTPAYLALQLSNVFTEFIRTSYTAAVSGDYIPEKEITHYNDFLKKNYKAFNSNLTDGVYKSFKNFYFQEPDADYNVVKNKKGNVTKIQNDLGQTVSLSEIYCFVDNGKAYRITPLGFIEMQKNEKDFFIVSSRRKLLSSNNNSDGIVIGAIAAGGIGALVGAVIQSEINKGTVNGVGYRTSTEMNIYIDSLSGAYVFEK